MIVQHNLQAMNANRMLGITSGQAGKSTEKLSSGYKINRAADDAAGLAISEKMRKQIRGLGRASLNAEDGISCVQTAEGAMAEVQDMLQRMNELCVQAANGTNSETDRRYIQDEIDQLVTEIDRVAETTKFNETYLLKGDDTKPKASSYITNYSMTYTKNLTSNAAANANAMDYLVNYNGSNNVIMVNSDILKANSMTKLSADIIKDGDDITKYMQKTTATATALTVSYSAAPVSKYVETTTSTRSKWYLAGSATPATSEEIASNIVYKNGTATFAAGIQYYTAPATITQYGSQIPQANGNIVQPTTISTYFKNQISGFYSNNPATITVPEANLSQYFNADGTYKGGLYKITNEGTTATVGADQVYKYVKIYKPGDLMADNSHGAVLSASYTAFISSELNSNLGTGRSGSVDGTDAYDLSTDGVNDTVRANRDLFILDTKNNTVVHLNGGDEMTDYLNDDNTMKDRYRLIDILDNNREIAGFKKGSSVRVQEQALGDAGFKWTDDNIEAAVSMQKLYDSDGMEVSGIRLNDFFDKNGNYTGGLFTTSQARAIDEVFANDKSLAFSNISSILGKSAATIGAYISQAAYQLTAGLDLALHTGADSDRANRISMSIDTITAAGLGIDKLASWNIGIVDATGENATDAIDVVGEALQKVSRLRSNLGAIQNRLEHTIKNLDNVVENTTAAEATIRDTDMADEMVKYSNTNILQQAGQSMLAQANQANQGVLSLLQ